MAILQRKKKQVEDGEGKSHFYHRFAQQELAGWSPVVTAKAVVIYFFVVAAVCVALGVPVLIASLGIVQYSVRYDDQGPMAREPDDQARPPTTALAVQACSLQMLERSPARVSGVAAPACQVVTQARDPALHEHTGVLRAGACYAAA